jgi:phage-related protein
MRWTVETLNALVDDEIEELPTGLRAKLLRLMGAVQSHGLDQMREPQVKHMDGKLWPQRAIKLALARMKEVK